MTKRDIFTVKTTHLGSVGATGVYIAPYCSKYTQTEKNAGSNRLGVFSAWSGSHMKYTWITNQDDRGWAATNCRELERVDGCSLGGGGRWEVGWVRIGKDWGNYFLLHRTATSLSEMMFFSVPQTSPDVRGVWHFWTRADTNTAFFHSASWLWLSARRASF